MVTILCIVFDHMVMLNNLVEQIVQRSRYFVITMVALL